MLFSPTFGDDDASYAREGADPSPTNAGAASSSQPQITVVRTGEDLRHLEGYLRQLHGKGRWVQGYGVKVAQRSLARLRHLFATIERVILAQP